MMLYRWPGNVRQLKNIVEQLALFNAGEEISRRQLIELLPLDRSGSSSLVAATRDGTYESEREMLWQLVYQLRHELSDLRARIDGINPAQEPPYGSHDSTKSLIKYEVSPTDNDECNSAVEEVVAVPTLEDSERNAVAAALRRNGGNKKKAAEQLNISPRTLYRKIHELGLQLDEGAESEQAEL